MLVKTLREGGPYLDKPNLPVGEYEAELGSVFVEMSEDNPKLGGDYPVYIVSNGGHNYKFQPQDVECI